MRNIIIIVLIFIIGMISCSDSKNKSKEKRKHYSEKIDNEKYKIKWINYKFPNNIERKLEVYITKEKDTIYNQIITSINGEIDSTQSMFYEINLTKSEKIDTYNGIFKFYSENDSNPKNIDEKKSLRLTIFQKSKDSFYTQSFESRLSNEVEFELVNFENDQLVGIMTEFRVIENDKAGKDMVDVISTQMPVDNKRNTHNMAIEVYGIK
jgi:hypothetical protein